MSKAILTVTWIVLLIDGIWSHDWREMLAAVAVAMIWPLIREEVRDAGRASGLIDPFDLLAFHDTSGDEPEDDLAESA